MNDDPQDPMPALIAAIDQACATAPAIAQYARALFVAFTDEGFTEAQALQLTIARMEHETS